MRNFTHWAALFAHIVGHPYFFFGCLFIVMVWVATGPLLGFSDTWQLVINTFTTVATWLMVALLQNSQNRKDEALHKKIDELIRALPQADDSIRGIEHEEHI